MRRRDFITVLGGAAAWPLAARAQQQMQVIGLLNGQSSGTSTNALAALRQGLAAAGFVEGRNLAIVYRGADGDIARLPALAAELVRIPVAVIAAVGGDNAVLSAKAATATIPIVFTTGGDPVDTGIVARLNRPGGNVTGASFLGSLVATKQIGLLRDMVPKLATIGLLVAHENPMTPSIIKEAQEAAQVVGLKTVVMEVNSDRDIDDAFARFVEQHVDGLVISSAVFLNRRQDRLAVLATRHAIPAIFTGRDFPANGGLMSYGADATEAYRQAGIYVGRILKGEKPADLPVMQPTKFELVINLKTAKTLGLTVSNQMQLLADEVIE
jgi:putative ABC transport system substrate-binding protein